MSDQTYIISARAGATLTSALYQAVYYDGADSEYVKVATDPDDRHFLGLLQNAPADDTIAKVAVLGPAFGIAGEALEMFDLLQVGASGRLYKLTAGNNAVGRYIPMPKDGNTGGTNTDAAAADTIRVYLFGGVHNASGQILYGTKTADLGAIAPGARVTDTITVTGAATGDVVAISAPSLEEGLSLEAYVSAANTVTYTVTNAGPKVLSGSATVDLGAVSPGTPVTSTITVTGAATGDTVAMSAPSLEAGLVIIGHVSAADTVTFELHNVENEMLFGSAVIDFGSIADGNTLTSTVTVTGAATGDAAFVSGSAALPVGVSIDAWVNAADTVTVRATSAVAAGADPDSMTYYVGVIRASAAINPASQTYYAHVFPASMSINPASQAYNVAVIKQTQIPT